MIKEQWKKIGIQGDVLEQERGLATKRVQSNEHQVLFETQWGTDNIFGHTRCSSPTSRAARLGRCTASGSPAAARRAKSQGVGCVS